MKKFAPGGKPGAADRSQLFNGSINAVVIGQERKAGEDFAGGIEPNAVCTETFGPENPRFKAVHRAGNSYTFRSALFNRFTHFQNLHSFIGGAAGAAAPVKYQQTNTPSGEPFADRQPRR